MVYCVGEGLQRQFGWVHGCSGVVGWGCRSSTAAGPCHSLAFFNCQYVARLDNLQTACACTRQLLVLFGRLGLRNLAKAWLWAKELMAAMSKCHTALVVL